MHKPEQSIKSGRHPILVPPNRKSRLLPLHQPARSRGCENCVL